MRQSQINVGDKVVTRVSGQRVWVEVVSERIVVTIPRRHSSPRRLTRYLVKRVDNGHVLPNLRPASALHVDDSPFPD